MDEISRLVYATDYSPRVQALMQELQPFNYIILINKGPGQDSETGCPQMANVKYSLGHAFFKGGINYFLTKM